MPSGVNMNKCFAPFFFFFRPHISPRLSLSLPLFIPLPVN